MSQPGSGGPPPQAVLMQMMYGPVVAKSLQAAADLAIADLLADRPMSSAEIAAATGTNASALFRLLRALASAGVFRDTGGDRFENTPLSEALRSGGQGSVRDYVRYAAHDGNLLAWMRVDEVLRTGAPSFEAATGHDLWDYFRLNPAIGARFDAAMTSLSAGSLRALLAAYGFSRFSTLVDVGGGQGLLLAGILAATPRLRGVLFDQPSALERAPAVIEATGVSDRCDLVGGDFFREVPAGHDAYLLRQVLHDWDDARAADILRRCREASRQDSTLLVLESVIAEGNAPHPAKWIDLHMMVALGGRERSEAEWRALLPAAGFAVRQVIPMPGPLSLIEATPG